MDWQTIAAIASSLGFILAILVFAWEIRANRRERDLSVFLRFLDAYEKVQARRRQQWSKVKEVIQSNPHLKDEIGDRTSTLDYLLIRSQQPEQMFAVEHGIIELEIQSLNILNELCRLSTGDQQRNTLLASFCGSEISYYQNRLNDLLALREREAGERLFSVPRHEALIKFTIHGFFDAPPKTVPGDV